MQIVNFVVENWEAIIGILVAVHAVALGIANLTDTPKDNEWVGKAYKVIEFLAGISDRAKTLPGESVEDVKLSKADLKANSW
jgi:hypothetical protein